MDTAPVLPADLVLLLTEGVEMTFQRIPAGEFRMGARGEYRSEEPLHHVRITRPFYLGTFPVTQAQFAVWTQSAGIEHKNGFPDKPSHPAESMDWHQAVAFCDWLTQTCLRQTVEPQLPPGCAAGLPTEAQWEYACRAGTETEYHTGDGEAALAEAGWYEGNEGSSTHPVGLRAANAFGLHDMHGNVWEWCRDAWDEFAYARRVDGECDPEVIGDDVSDENLPRVLRGGSWVGSGGDCRASYRIGRRPDIRFRDLGFRVCLFPGPVPADSGTEAESEPASGDEARRQAAAKA